MVLKYSRPKRSKTKTKTSQMGLETVSRPRHVSRPNITGFRLTNPTLIHGLCLSHSVFKRTSSPKPPLCDATHVGGALNRQSTDLPHYISFNMLLVTTSSVISCISSSSFRIACVGHRRSMLPPGAEQPNNYLASRSIYLGNVVAVRGESERTTRWSSRCCIPVIETTQSMSIMLRP